MTKKPKKPKKFKKTKKLDPNTVLESDIKLKLSNDEKRIAFEDIENQDVNTKIQRLRQLKQTIDNMEYDMTRKSTTQDDDYSTAEARCEVIDLTSIFKDYCGIEKEYCFPSEQDLAKYAVTKFVKDFGTTARDSRNFAKQPSTCTVITDIRESTVVFQDITSNIEVKYKSETIRGMIQAIQFRDSYNVMFAAENKRDLAIIENKYLKILEYNNFFQGKSLRFSSSGVVFIPSPNITLEDAVLPEKVIDEYKLNVIEFLTKDIYHEITKKRALLLYGPPGGGKTTSLKALFSVLRKENITCMYLTDDTFKSHSMESIFDFINKYLSPCLIGFEDIDLIGEDRRHVRGIIGSLLSVLNGVEDYKKPIVIIGTTNRHDVLDDAVTRPCRFDRKLFIDFPTTKALQIMFKNMMGFEPPENVIIQTDNGKNKLTGAHVKEICDTAKILAARSGKKVKNCVKDSVETIKESFYIENPTLGFSNRDGDPVECYPEPEACCDQEKEIDPFEKVR